MVDYTTWLLTGQRPTVEKSVDPFDVPRRKWVSPIEELEPEDFACYAQLMFDMLDDESPKH